MSTSTTAPRLRLLDGTRFIAALGILLYHYTARYPSQVEDFGWFSYVATYAALLVYSFFIISGFVILMTTWGRDLPSYVASRVGRLYPAYWAAVLIAGFIVLILRPSFPGEPWRDIGWEDWAINFTMVQEAFGASNLDGVYWTLYMELKFYLLIGVFLLIGITRERVLAFTLLWPLIAAWAKSADNALLVELLMPNQAPLFAFGMVLYLIHRDGGFRVDTALALGMNVAFIIYRSADAYTPFMDRTDEITPHSGIVTAVLLVTAFAMWAFSCTRLQYVRWGWLTTAGALTYPLYLVHERLGWYVIETLRDHGWAAWPAVGGAVVVVAIATVALYRWVDKPFSGHFRRVIERQLRREVAPHSKGA